MHVYVIILQNGGLLDKSLEFGNAIWVAKEEDIKATYRQESASVFYTDVQKLKDAETVNKWVSERTNGKIKKLFGKYINRFVLPENLRI